MDCVFCNIAAGKIPSELVYRDEEVVEYALSRSLSPTMVARYLTQLPEKKLLQQKLHELFEKEEKQH